MTGSGRYRPLSAIGHPVSTKLAANARKRHKCISAVFGLLAYCMGMAKKNHSGHPRQTYAIMPEESPEGVHRVALHVGAIVECQEWMRHSLELKRQGKLRAA